MCDSLNFDILIRLNVPSVELDELLLSVSLFLLFLLHIMFESHFKLQFPREEGRSTKFHVLSPCCATRPSKSRLFSYEHPSLELEQFCAMSTALNDFIDSNDRQIIPSTNPKMSTAVFTRSKIKSAVLVSSQWKFFHSGNYRPCSVVQSQSFTPGFISGGSFVNCTFNFNFNRS